MENFYSGKTVLITGASSGLGQEFACQLAPQVNKLVLVARRMDRLEALKAELSAKHPQLEIANFGVDLADPKARRLLIENLLQLPAAIDILINNAGLGDIGKFRSADWEKTQAILEVNMGALTELSHAFLPGMLKNRSGGILNIASISSLFPLPKLAVYAATKAYVASFSEALRAELQGTGVGVTTVCPGPVETEFGMVANRKQKKDLPVPAWIKVTPEQVVRDSLRAFAAKRARIFPGFAVQMFALIMSLIPMFLLRPLLGLTVRN